MHIVRLYRGDDVDLVRRTLIGSGAPMVAPGTPGRELAPGLAPADAPALDDELLLAGRPQRLGPRAGLIEASERDYRVVLATDAVSQDSPQGFAELAGIGTVLLDGAAIAEGLLSAR